MSDRDWFYEIRETYRLFGVRKLLYWRFIYHHHMRFLHRFGQHQLHQRPIDGLMHCDWCGHTEAATPPE